MFSLEQRLTSWLQQPIIALGYEYVGLQLLTNRRPVILRVYIDKTEGNLSADDCAVVSRQVSRLLDVHEPLKGSYHLEISSPGLERPLFTLEHYQRFVGSRVVIVLQLPIQGRRQWKGVLEAVNVNELSIVLQVEDTQQQLIELGNIREAHLIPSI